MDSFNIIWCTPWSDYFMTQHQYDNENRRFNVSVAVAADFLFFYQRCLDNKKLAITLMMNKSSYL
jgi:hypothetical protein